MNVLLFSLTVFHVYSIQLEKPDKFLLQTIAYEIHLVCTVPVLKFTTMSIYMKKFKHTQYMSQVKRGYWRCGHLGV